MIQTIKYINVRVIYIFIKKRLSIFVKPNIYDAQYCSIFQFFLLKLLIVCIYICALNFKWSSCTILVKEFNPSWVRWIKTGQRHTLEEI